MIKLNLDPPRHQLSQFGAIALLGFPAIGWIATAKWGAPGWVLYALIGLGVLCFAASRVNPGLLKPLFVGLMVVATPIGFVISIVLMGLIYYGLFTPVGLLFRLMGRDPLAKRPDPAVTSYWHVRPTSKPKASYLRLY
ncbi:MAG: SxtJ family membrane protein [Planctomycetota bacterium]